MATIDEDLLLATAETLESTAEATLDRALEFATIAGGDPTSALADFEKAGALAAAAQLARKRAEDA